MSENSIVYNLERKLSPRRFRRRGANDKLCKISSAYYWDLLTYVDDDYLTDWEIYKFKHLY